MRSVLIVIARSEATKQSSPLLRQDRLDCFASLAMTSKHRALGNQRADVGEGQGTSCEDQICRLALPIECRWRQRVLYGKPVLDHEPSQHRAPCIDARMTCFPGH